MINKLIIIIFLGSFGLSSSKSNQILLNYLKDDNEWILIDSQNDNTRIFEKNIPKMSLNALKVEKIIEINPEEVFKVVMDIENYSDVMDNESMVSYIIGVKDNHIYAYNSFSIPIPFINDRHYFFKINRISDNEINWTLVSREEVASSRQLKKILNKNKEAVYINYGAGMWKIDQVSENLNKVSYALYMDSGGQLSNYLNDLLVSESIILLFKGVLNKSKGF